MGWEKRNIKGLWAWQCYNTNAFLVETQSPPWKKCMHIMLQLCISGGLLGVCFTLFLIVKSVGICRHHYWPRWYWVTSGFQPFSGLAQNFADFHDKPRPFELVSVCFVSISCGRAYVEMGPFRCRVTIKTYTWNRFSSLTSLHEEDLRTFSQSHTLPDCSFDVFPFPGETVAPVYPFFVTMREDATDKRIVDHAPR